MGGEEVRTILSGLIMLVLLNATFALIRFLYELTNCFLFVVPLLFPLLFPFGTAIIAMVVLEKTGGMKEIDTVAKREANRIMRTYDKWVEK